MTNKSARWLVAFMIIAMFVLLLIDIGRAQTIPAPKGYVSDYAGILTKAETDTLNGMIKNAPIKMAVVIVPDLQGYTIEDFTHKLATTWKVGEKGKDNGVVIVLSTNPRKVWIATGYGVEGKLPDSICKRIFEQDMKPFLKNNQWFNGLKAGVTAIINRVK